MQRECPAITDMPRAAKTVETICREAWNMGIKYLTVYAFSTENWKRPQDEVDALMKLLRNYMKNCLKTAEKNQMRVRVIGDKTGWQRIFRRAWRSWRRRRRITTA